MTFEEILIREDAEGLQSKLQELIRRKSEDDTVILKIDLLKTCDNYGYAIVSLSFPNSKERFSADLDYDDEFDNSNYLEEIMATIFESYDDELRFAHEWYKGDERFANLIRAIALKDSGLYK